jgi:hypothetical protein
MTTFISVSLYIFAGCAALGLLPAAVLAARARQPVMIAISLLIAVFVIFVLVTAAAELPRR